MDSKLLSNNKIKEKDDALIDVNETKPTTSTNNNNNNQKETIDTSEPVNASVDISDDQLLELKN